jgi:hypothetical protein
MRKTLTMVVLAAGVLSAVPVQAGTGSFANRSLGLSVGGFRLFGENEAVDWGLPISLEGGYYLSDGFDLYLRVPFMLMYQRVGVTETGGGLIFATGGQFGVRYLFLEEDLRPYVNLHLAGLYFVRNQNLGNFFFGPGFGGGLEYFVGESVAVGARAYVDLFINLNQPLRYSIGGQAYVTTYF